jgi:hypothetical protein
MEGHYRRTAAYQRPKILPETEASKVTDSGRFGTYSETLDFFLAKIGEMGVQRVIQKYVLAENDELATDLLERLYLSHPLISLAFGLEFDQPSIVAEGLAMAAVSEKRVDNCLSLAEKTANASAADGLTMNNIIENIGQDEEIICIRDNVGPAEIPDKLSNGPLAKCREKVIKYFSMWKVEASEESVKQKMAELINCSGRT